MAMVASATPASSRGDATRASMAASVRSTQGEGRPRKCHTNASPSTRTANSTDSWPAQRIPGVGHKDAKDSEASTTRSPATRPSQLERAFIDTPWTTPYDSLRLVTLSRFLNLNAGSADTSRAAGVAGRPGETFRHARGP